MSQKRRNRIDEELHRTLAVLLSELKDPRIQKSMPSVTRVEATGDLKYAKVYISVLDTENSKEILKLIKATGGFLRREVAHRINLRNTPELIFELDESILRGAYITNLINKVNREDEEK